MDQDIVIIYLRWVDAVSSDQWTTINEVEHFAHEIHTVGMLLNENEKYITVNMNLDPHGERISMTMVIPKSWIIHREEIKFKAVK